MDTTGWKSRRREISGFTMVEIMVAVAIVGILAAIAVVAYTSYLPHVRIKNAARTLAVDLLHARQLAAKEGRIFYAMFSTSTESYKIFRVAAGTPCTDTGSGGSSRLWDFFIGTAWAASGGGGSGGGSGGGAPSADTTSCDDGTSDDGAGGEQLYLTGTMPTGVDLNTAKQANGTNFSKLYFCTNGLVGIGAQCLPTSASFPITLNLKLTGGSETRLVSVLVSGAVTVK